MEIAKKKQQFFFRLPSPVVPNFSLIPEVLVEGFIISLISLSIAISIGKMLAEQQNYEYDAAQELLAEGAANIFGAFFTTLSANNTIARTLVQVSAGGKSQVRIVLFQ